jgi:hypothetical protein
MTAFFFTSLTASTGQSRTQNPQPMHFSGSTFMVKIGLDRLDRLDRYVRFVRLDGFDR